MVWPTLGSRTAKEQEQEHVFKLQKMTSHLNLHRKTKTKKLDIMKKLKDKSKKITCFLLRLGLKVGVILFVKPFYPLDAMLARVLAMTMRPSMSVTSRCSIEMDGQIELVFSVLAYAFFRPVLHCVLRKFRYL